MNYHSKRDIHQVLEELRMESSPCAAGVGKGFVEEAGLQRGLRRIRALRDKQRERGKGRSRTKTRSLGHAFVPEIH